MLGPRTSCHAKSLATRVPGPHAVKTIPNFWVAVYQKSDTCRLKKVSSRTYLGCATSGYAHTPGPGALYKCLPDRFRA